MVLICSHILKDLFFFFLLVNFFLSLGERKVSSITHKQKKKDIFEKT